MHSTIFLADTNVLSELFRPRPDPGVVAWAEGVPLIKVSVMSVEELFFGLAWKPNPRIRARLEEFLDSFCEVLSVNDAIGRHAAQLRGHFRSRGIARSQTDMLIAATADLHQLTVVTRNVRDFDDCRVPLFNPFQEAPGS